MKPDELTDIVMGNILSKYFSWFRLQGLKSRHILRYQPAGISQKPNMRVCGFLIFNLFEEVHEDNQK